jgi:NSS family neurotransmitter:Na+ symporter
MQREQWGSRLGFILAAAGSAIGLGNIWKFPYIAGENGGGAFVVVYLVCIVMIGLPIMLSEFLIGRKSQRNPVGAYKSIKPDSLWFLVGGMGVVAGFIILSYYGVVAGWTFGYIIESLRGVFFELEDPDMIREHFTQFAADPVKAVGYHALFIALCMLIVIKGIKIGIERWSRILMPTLLAILVLLIIRGLTLEGAMAGVEFFLKPDFSKLGPESVLIALGHAFFTLSLGMGAMITYGSYLRRADNLPQSAFIVSILDTVIALMAGIAIFPAVFAMGQPPDVGPGLVFVSLPAVFVKMPGGAIFAPLFFFLLSIAALTSGISLLEVVTAYFVDEKGYSRAKAVTCFGIVIFLLGIPSALSMGLLSDFTIIRWNFFDLVDHISANYLLPLGGLFISIFIGWIWGVRKAADEARKGNPAFSTARMWSVLIKYVCPFIVGQIILFEGVLNEFKGEAIGGMVVTLKHWAGVLDIFLLLFLLLLALYFRFFKPSGDENVRM